MGGRALQGEAIALGDAVSDIRDLAPECSVQRNRVQANASTPVMAGDTPGWQRRYGKLVKFRFNFAKKYRIGLSHDFDAPNNLIIR